MSGRDWANTSALEELVARAVANGADEWTLSAENRTRAFLDEKERLQRLQRPPGKPQFLGFLPSNLILNCITLCPTIFWPCIILFSVLIFSPFDLELYVFPCYLFCFYGVD